MSPFSRVPNLSLVCTQQCGPSSHRVCTFVEVEVEGRDNAWIAESLGCTHCGTQLVQSFQRKKSKTKPKGCSAMMSRLPYRSMRNNVWDCSSGRCRRLVAMDDATHRPLPPSPHSGRFLPRWHAMIADRMYATYLIGDTAFTCRRHSLPRTSPSRGAERR